ncbi:MAG: DNA-binding protein [Planctomycetes bacterium]|nr:DNA-binding protein [Planctomycetota bacterium]
MEHASLAITRIHILRIDPGEDVLASVKRFLAEAGVRRAVVLGA